MNVSLCIGLFDKGRTGDRLKFRALVKKGDVSFVLKFYNEVIVIEIVLEYTGDTNTHRVREFLVVVKSCHDEHLMGSCDINDLKVAQFEVVAFDVVHLVMKFAYVIPPLKVEWLLAEYQYFPVGILA